MQFFKGQPRPYLDPSISAKTLVLNLFLSFAANRCPLNDPFVYYHSYMEYKQSVGSLT
jgi:hypothetical protein